MLVPIWLAVGGRGRGGVGVGGGGCWQAHLICTPTWHLGRGNQHRLYKIYLRWELCRQHHLGFAPRMCPSITFWTGQWHCQHRLWKNYREVGVVTATIWDVPLHDIWDGTMISSQTAMGDISEIHQLRCTPSWHLGWDNDIVNNSYGRYIWATSAEM